jgi:hypothetical protein
MVKIKESLGFGIISHSPSAVKLTITKKSDIKTLISLFDLFILRGSKSKDLVNFSKIQLLINNNLHKTEEGLKKIRMIKREMNINTRNES